MYALMFLQVALHDASECCKSAVREENERPLKGRDRSLPFYSNIVLLGYIDKRVWVPLSWANPRTYIVTQYS